MSGDKFTYIYVNDKYVPAEKAAVHAYDAGFLYGDGLFETLRAYRTGGIFAFDLHLDRFFSSMYLLKYNPYFDRDFLKERTEGLLKKNGLGRSDAYIKIIVTRARYRNRFEFDFWCRPNLIIIAKKFTPYPVKFYNTGIKIVNSSIKRNPVGNELYRHKLLNYFENIYAKNEAYAAGGQEAFFSARDRSVLECASSNIFTVRDNRVFTPTLTQNILPGVTRKLVIDICKDRKINFSERRLHYYNLVEADEIFITSSLMEIMPVKEVDGHAIGCGKVPGPVTDLVSMEYKKLTSLIDSTIRL